MLYIGIYLFIDGRAGGGGQRGHAASDINDDEFEEVMVHEIGRSHSGGHIPYDKSGTTCKYRSKSYLCKVWHFCHAALRLKICER